MIDLSITYSFGEIQEIYRGDRVIILTRDDSLFNPPSILTFGMRDNKLIKYTAQDNTPVRMYIGVNSIAKNRLEAALVSYDGQGPCFLDISIVRDDAIVNKVEDVKNEIARAISAKRSSGSL